MMVITSRFLINVFLNCDVKIKAGDKNWDEEEDSRVSIFPKEIMSHNELLLHISFPRAELFNMAKSTEALLVTRHRGRQQIKRGSSGVVKAGNKITSRITFSVSYMQLNALKT